MQNTNTNVSKKLLQQKEKRQEVCNKTTNSSDLKIGGQQDIVYLSNENRKKLDPFYIGPFIVTDTLHGIDEPNCKIKHRDTLKETIVHKNRTIKI